LAEPIFEGAFNNIFSRHEQLPIILQEPAV